MILVRLSRLVTNESEGKAGTGSGCEGWYDPQLRPKHEASEVIRVLLLEDTPAHIAMCSGITDP
jgi:hypothetical protein